MSLETMDSFSRFLKLIPLPALPTALETAELIFHHLLRYYGLPKDIVSDRGPQFTSHITHKKLIVTCVHIAPTTKMTGPSIYLAFSIHKIILNTQPPTSPPSNV